MSERRTGNRRRTPGPDESLERKRERRMGDRRDSQRVPMNFLVRDATAKGSYEEFEGDLSIGGIYWRGDQPPSGNEVEVRFRLTGIPKEIRASGEIIQLAQSGGKMGFHVRFTELDVASELAIARFLDSQR